MHCEVAFGLLVGSEGRSSHIENHETHTETMRIYVAYIQLDPFLADPSEVRDQPESVKEQVYPAILLCDE